jgi:predicted DNA-binding transcriptional regulator YafY
MSDKGDISQRAILVNEVKVDYIKAFCFIKQQTRMFKLNNIISVAKPKRKEGVKYA